MATLTQSHPPFQKTMEHHQPDRAMTSRPSKQPWSLTTASGQVS